MRIGASRRAKRRNAPHARSTRLAARMARPGEGRSPERHLTRTRSSAAGTTGLVGDPSNDHGRGIGLRGCCGRARYPQPSPSTQPGITQRARDPRSRMPELGMSGSAGGPAQGTAQVYPTACHALRPRPRLLVPSRVEHGGHCTISVTGAATLRHSPVRSAAGAPGHRPQRPRRDACADLSNTAFSPSACTRNIHHASSTTSRTELCGIRGADFVCGLAQAPHCGAAHRAAPSKKGRQLRKSR